MLEFYKRKVKALLDVENPYIKFDQGTLWATVSGDIDHHCAKHIREKIDSAMFEFKPSSVMLDLSSVEFMDSSGLGLILGRYNTASELCAEFKIFSPSKNVRRILELAGIERIIKIVGDIRV